MAGTATGAWFEGADGKSEAEAEFLASLRTEADAWCLPGLEPGDTSSEDYLHPLYVVVEVPMVVPQDKDSVDALQWAFSLGAGVLVRPAAPRVAGGFVGGREQTA